MTIDWKKLFKKLTIGFFVTSIIFGIKAKKNKELLEKSKKYEGEDY